MSKEGEVLDYLDLSKEFTEEERQIRDTAREFVENEVKPHIGEWFLEGEFPDDLIEPMGDLGFYAPNLEGYGSPNVSDTAYGLLMQELEAGDSGLRSMASVQGALVMYPIHRYGTESQKERYLEQLGRGKTVGCFGLTEPEHGSEPSAMETTAEYDDDRYVLNGRKTWITNSPIADVAVVWAKTMDDPDLEDGTVRGFLVETDLPGVETNPIDEKLSLRASHTGDIGLNHVEVPVENVLEVAGMKGPLSCLNQARYGIVWGAVGAARDCFHEARDYSLEREQWGREIGGFQIQQEKLAEMATGITNGQLQAYRLGELKEKGELKPQQVSMGKRYNVNMARETAGKAREMLGGNGITVDYSPMRHLANMETVYTYEGTHDIHTLIVGHEVTGLRAFKG
ncbi:MAG: acyl-CoA dehydrogenase family protein [Halobacteria archaeon]